MLTHGRIEPEKRDLNVTKRGSSALVVFSGGQDSTTCLAWALGEFKEVNAISFNYRQRHGVELESAKKIISLLNQGEMQLEGVSWKGKIGHEIIDVGFLSDTLQTAMIQESEITHDEETGLPTTFVPGRNIFFLSIAAAVAYQRKVKHLVTGVCQTDYSDYPDCRDATIKSLQATLRLGLDYDVILLPPLVWNM